MVLEREASFKAFYGELGGATPRTGRSFVVVEQLDQGTVDTLNRVLVGEEKPSAIVTAMLRLSRDALTRVMPVHKRYMLEAA